MLALVRSWSGVTVGGLASSSTAILMVSKRSGSSSTSSVCHLQSHLCARPSSMACIVSAGAGAVVACPSTSSVGGMRPSRLLRRPQTIKPNPNEATSGQFERSFEKLTDKIESRLPFRQHHVLHGNIYEQPYGERSEHDMWVEAQEDLHGREKEKPAARQVRSYFSDEDLSPEAMHVRSPQLKVAQNLQRQAYDKKILKTTAEPAAYYYPVVTLEEKRRYRWKLIAGWSAVGMMTLTGLRHLCEHMRTAG
ncbi:hypothetical protein conserved [Leishmania donovani]|uniref:Hypothetical_protein_conserved n=1 Tax=Leishmania donovani TaxID=5661 RepID=A0A3S7X940_LEIDO|nr:hypothetical protein, conserved [Leishmania donovani]AYU82894.1 hypothetical protein LdCL_350014400 [Leishmania donovani]TPP44371.1 hypothetical protein CGC21_6020 [Leishmania donovani]CAJ1992902.1 hypothetical protein conserved [Leishmania donovani]CBZ38001.1 hypothetical protein, conserved [Leishmania donovani]VDZ48732.1 hypothetical_protein_conserved [Leishmania donovani]